MLFNVIQRAKDKRRKKRFFKRNGGLFLNQQEAGSEGLYDVQGLILAVKNVFLPVDSDDDFTEFYNDFIERKHVHKKVDPSLTLKPFKLISQEIMMLKPLSRSEIWAMHSSCSIAYTCSSSFAKLFSPYVPSTLLVVLCVHSALLISFQQLYFIALVSLAIGS
ncbi:hypothetical protein L1987_13392 [Smallanthus sonchifolius]|uniref:Uncharacterized protein n=1 Tax=Smallanthus sonchifolius TaxID=185202 RepID=A0ACB9JII9_9ASTR|nr:hypothetical protein L1987_13392 [Smallanthus sonchifolius]